MSDTSRQRLVGCDHCGVYSWVDLADNKPSNRPTSIYNQVDDRSGVRLRILKLLAESSMLTVSDIAAKTGVNYASAKAHLETLEGEDVLSHAMFGKRIRYYKFKDSARTTAVKALLEAFEQKK